MSFKRLVLRFYYYNNLARARGSPAASRNRVISILETSSSAAVAEASAFVPKSPAHVYLPFLRTAPCSATRDGSDTTAPTVFGSPNPDENSANRWARLHLPRVRPGHHVSCCAATRHSNGPSPLWSLTGRPHVTRQCHATLSPRSRATACINRGMGSSQPVFAAEQKTARRCRQAHLPISLLDVPSPSARLPHMRRV